MSQIRVFVSKGESPIEGFTVGDKPYLFWDTCALLNFMSINQRSKFGEFEFYKKIFELIKKRELISVTSSIVYREFNDHINDLYKEDIKREDGARNCFVAYAETLPPDKMNNLKDSLKDTKFSDMRLNMLNDLWASTIVFSENDKYMKAAHTRVLNKICPAHTKGEYKDCFIWETYLHFLSHVSNQVKCFFFTVNSEDFGIIKGSKDPNRILVEDTQDHKSEIYLTVERAQVGIFKSLGLI